MASPEEIEAIEKAKILVVGAGGIGCELLKTLALTGFRHIHVIDLDTIEVSNLNRQFLFRKRHIGLSKAKVAREAVLKFKPDINIVAYHSNVKNTEFDVDFFKQFNVVLNGLDNLDARRHVNRLCLAANVPLVESGTMGYLGQVTVHIKGRTECYECQPKPAPKTYPVCTINSTPSKPVHCIVWAKELLFTRLFGDRSQSNDLVMQSKDTDSNDTNATTATSEEDSSTVFEIKDGESLEAYSRRIFDGVFGHNIEAALKNEAAWKTRAPPTPLYLRDILPDAELLETMRRNKTSNLSEASSVSVLGILGLKNPQEIWTLKENAGVFLESLKHFLGSRKKEIGNLVFDKDDQLAVEFVTAAANLRAASFGIPMLNLFEAKGIAGNIVHAIATTNATISGLIVLEAMKVLTNNINQCRMTYCLEHPSKKLLLMPVEPFEMNTRCYVCSETPLYLEVDSLRTKLRDVVEKIVKKKLSVNSPIIMHGSNLLYETGDDLEENMVTQYNANLDKVLASLPTPVVNGSILSIEDLQQEFLCSLQIKHRETFDEEKEPDNMILSGDVASVVGKETISNVSTANEKKGKEEANGDGQEGEEEDIVLMIEAPDRKRKLIDDDSCEGTSSGKRVRIDIS